MNRGDRIYITAVLVCAIVFLVLAFLPDKEEAPLPLAVPPSESAVPGTIRDVDATRMRGLIHDSALSDHEADFCRPLPAPAAE